MKKVKVDGMILATFFSQIFYSATYPFIHRQLMAAVSDELIALDQIIMCVSIIVAGAVWNRWSKKLFPFYPYICVLETLCGIATTTWAIQTNALAAYYLLDTIVFSVVTRNIICGGNRLRILRYVDETEREHFSNNNNSASALATIIGSLIAMKLDLSFPVMLCLATFGNAIDNIFYIVIYYSTVKKTGSSK